jgi:fructose-bisphosphate aldolase, class I
MDGVAKMIRWSRFLDRRSGRGIIIPIDHGLTIGPLEGLNSVEQVSRWIGHSAITGIVAHKGMVARLGGQGLLRGVGIMVHLNGMTSIAPEPDRKERVTSIEAAARLGADGVSLQINFDGKNDAHNLTQLGAVVDEAQRHGLPVLTMLYDKVPCEDAKRVERQKHLMRACVELGTDALKLAAPQNLAELPELLEGVHEHTAVFFAGGALRSEEDTLRLAQHAVAAGAVGLCAGRNVFQRDASEAILTRLSEVVFKGASAPPVKAERIPYRRKIAGARSGRARAAQEAVK